MQSRFLFDTTRARYIAEAGVHRASWEMRNTDIETRWGPDGRSYFIDFGDAELEIQLIDESGKIDRNSADNELRTKVFITRGLEETEAWQRADAIADWRG